MSRATQFPLARDVLITSVERSTGGDGSLTTEVLALLTNGRERQRADCVRHLLAGL